MRRENKEIKNGDDVEKGEEEEEGRREIIK